jgi:hypothetical protein
MSARLQTIQSPLCRIADHLVGVAGRFLQGVHGVTVAQISQGDGGVATHPTPARPPKK